VKRFVFLLFSIFILPFLFACAAKQNLVILLPDPDGKTGQIEVRNQKGTQVLSRPYQSTEIKSAKKAPSAPSKMDRSKVKEIFAPALEAQPEIPLYFLLYFKHDSTDLTEKSEKLLVEILEAIKKRKSRDVSVIGHTDTYGSKEYNFQLSYNRAMRVGEELTAIGIQKESIEIKSHGEGDPLIKTGDNVQEPRNRRVEVVVR
jgi:outer membrane protein OmpA-like peptidoglycan-associated protein